MISRIGLCILALVALPAATEEVSNGAAGRGITVSGVFSNYVEPDTAVWSLWTYDENLDAAKAKADSDGKTAAILKTARDLGIQEKDIATGELNISRVYDHPNGQDVFRGHSVRRWVSITLHDLTRFDEFYTQLVRAADAEIQVEMKSSKGEQMRWDARLKAVELAKKKATAMATALGVKVGRVLMLREKEDRYGIYHPRSSRPSREIPWLVDNAPPAVYPSADNWESPTDASTMAPGRIGIQMAVEATFELE